MINLTKILCKKQDLIWSKDTFRLYPGHIPRIILCCLFLSFNVPAAHAQTACERILDLSEEIATECNPIIDRKETTEAEMNVIIAEYGDRTARLDKMVVGVTDSYVLAAYRYTKFVLCSATASVVLFTNKQQNVSKAYDVLHEGLSNVRMLDDQLITDHDYITCTTSDGKAKVVSGSDYDKVASDYYFHYFSLAILLHKWDEVTQVFDHFRKVGFGFNGAARYGSTALIARAKLQEKTYDSTMFNAAAYAVQTFIRLNNFDYQNVPLEDIIKMLGMPELADKQSRTRAKGYHELGKEMNVFRLRHAYSPIFTEDQVALMYRQMAKSFTIDSEFPLVPDFKEYSSTLLTAAIALDDPELLKLITTRIEGLMETEKSWEFNDPLFWKNMKDLYTKVGNTEKADDAEKKRRKQMKRYGLKDE